MNNSIYKIKLFFSFIVVMSSLLIIYVYCTIKDLIIRNIKFIFALLFLFVFLIILNFYIEQYLNENNLFIII